MKFVATFTPGLSEVVTRFLKRYSVEKLRITRVEEGLLAGETTLSAEELSGIRFWHNVFVVAAEMEVPSVEALTAHLDTQALTALFARSPESKTVWLRVLEDGQPVRLSVHGQQKILSLLEDIGLSPATHHADAELWLVRRASGYAFAGLRLPSPRFKRRKRVAGELRPELAHLLGLIAGVNSKDIVLDPFAGYGAIPRELVAGFSPRKVIAIDSDARLVGNLRALAKEKPSLRVMVGDARAMKEISAESVTRVVTDPPWGEYRAANQPLEAFYAQLLAELARVLKPGSTAVIVSGAKEVLTEAIATQSAFEEVKIYHILVAGKKAVVIKLRKR